MQIKLDQENLSENSIRKAYQKTLSGSYVRENYHFFSATLVLITKSFTSFVYHNKSILS